MMTLWLTVAGVLGSCVIRPWSTWVGTAWTVGLIRTSTVLPSTICLNVENQIERPFI